MRAIHRLVAFFDPNLHGPRLVGFALGAAVPLVLMAVVATAYDGGLSDMPGQGEQAYFIQ